MKTSTKGRARGGGRGADRPRDGGDAWASWTRGVGPDARIVDILISAAYALGVAESLRDRVGQLHVVEDLPQALRHLDRAVESIMSAGSVIGCGTPKPVTIRRAAKVGRER